ncbi:hypothetical protein D3C78_1122880 [compost metagenome]
MHFATTANGDVLTYDIGPEGLYIKSGASSNTTILVGGQEVTDGKNTSKIQLNLDNGASDTGTNNSTNANPDATTNNGTGE